MFWASAAEAIVVSLHRIHFCNIKLETCTLNILQLPLGRHISTHESDSEGGCGWVMEMGTVPTLKASNAAYENKKFPLRTRIDVTKYRDPERDLL